MALSGNGDSALLDKYHGRIRYVHDRGSRILRSRFRAGVRGSGTGCAGFARVRQSREPIHSPRFSRRSCALYRPGHSLMRGISNAPRRRHRASGPPQLLNPPHKAPEGAATEASGLRGRHDDRSGRSH